jgi:hypothetical protein
VDGHSEALDLISDLKKAFIADPANDQSALLLILQIRDWQHNHVVPAEVL